MHQNGDNLQLIGFKKAYPYLGLSDMAQKKKKNSPKNRAMCHAQIGWDSCDLDMALNAPINVNEKSMQK